MEEAKTQQQAVHMQLRGKKKKSFKKTKDEKLALVQILFETDLQCYLDEEKAWSKAGQNPHKSIVKWELNSAFGAPALPS